MDRGRAVLENDQTANDSGEETVVDSKQGKKRKSSNKLTKEEETELKE